MGRKINILKEKFDFQRSKNFRLLNRIKINVTFYNFIISVKGCHCVYWPRAPKNLATPLYVRRHVECLTVAQTGMRQGILGAIANTIIQQSSSKLQSSLFDVQVTVHCEKCL